MGHTGINRKLPEKVDRKINVFARYCPDCHTPLARTNTVTTHIVEDIPEAQAVKTTVAKYTLKDNCAKPAGRK